MRQEQAVLRSPKVARSDRGSERAEDRAFAVRLAEKANALTAENTPRDAYRVAKRAVADTVGVALAGSRLAFVSALEGVLGPDEAGGPAVKIGRGGRTSALNAALVNGLSAHALDFRRLLDHDGRAPFGARRSRPDRAG